MRVLIINTSEKTGGAAVASLRLKDALNSNGVKAKMLVMHKETDDITVVRAGSGRKHPWSFLWERWCIFCSLHFSKTHLFDIDIANAGIDITKTAEFREADVIHLEWINQGMLSLRTLRKILDSGKAVVWTMHDMWPATGVCHLTMNCKRYVSGCGKCPYLPGSNANDLSAKVFKRKQSIIGKHSISFVACSKWLARQASASALFHDQRKVTAIPNPIDTHLFQPQLKAEARRQMGLPEDKKLILFAAQRATNVNKGMAYLVEACRRMAEEHPEHRENTGIVILGGHTKEYEDAFSMPVYPLGYVSDSHTIASIYNACDLFVLPSLSENLPNTIMEAMACGIPCVGFNVGGIPEMIDHRQNGYVAKLRDAEDLARGIQWVLGEADYNALSSAAVRKVQREYSQRSVARRYIEVYNQALAFKKCGL